jgi:hypothetical protein
MLSEITIGNNSCCHYDLSNIREKYDKYYFPTYYLEDYYIDYFTDNNIDYYYENNSLSVFKKDISWKTLYLLKTEAYSAINWYNELKEFTYNSELIEINKLNDLLDFNDSSLIFPKFIKLDTFSCKDTYHNGIFNSFREVYEIFSKSSRIINTLAETPLSKSHYLFIREPDLDISKKHEISCFIYNKRLTAISSDYKIHCKNQLEIFIKNIIDKLPFYDAVLDICIDNSNNFILIEVNNFGADSPCGAGLFNWREDYITLYGGMDNVIYKYL